MTIRQKLNLIFTKSEFKKVIFLFLGLILVGLLEVAGVSSIAPFMAVISSPSIIHENKYFEIAYQFLGAKSDNAFIILVGIFSIAVLLISNLANSIMVWSINYFSYLQTHRVSVRLLRQYLNRPYSFYLENNSSELSKNVLNEINRSIGGTVLPALNVLSKLIVTLFIFILLIYIDPKIALFSTVVLGLAYGAIYKFVRKKLHNIGIETNEANFQMYKVANESMSGIKDIKLRGIEEEFVGRFDKPSKKFGTYLAQRTVIALLPRYLLEVVAFSGIISVMIFFVSSGYTTSEILPIVSLYAMAGFRLLPAVQQIYSGVTIFKFNMPALENLYSDLTKVLNERNDAFNEKPIKLVDRLSIYDLNFAYSGNKNLVLKKLNFSINANTTIGIVGSTGSGKTTLVDLLLGLLSPESGKITVDGKDIDNTNIRSWQQSLGYVPQSIYLIDDTIEKNIAFAVPIEEIDKNLIKKATKLANLDNFITSLPEQFDTVVGERGVRLSGGQRQRIGIARALYHNPSVLFLDEATSSLDSITENVIMDAIHNLSHKKTIIMIAHRLSTLKECDIIHMMKNGNIVDSGTYQQLLDSNKDFKKMTKT
jgi:ATP-binding cassette, subfamily B, bacterial PglK